MHAPDEPPPMRGVVRAGDEAASELLSGGEAAIEMVPEHVRAAARSAFATRDLHAEVADLERDDLLEHGAGVRRRLLFAAGQGVVELAVHEAEPGRALVVEVRLSLPGGELVKVEAAGEPPTIQRVDDGCWRLAPVLPGLFSATLTVDRQRYRTTWVRL